ncbi:ABC transporter substrate-binding protein [Allosalinactinospora lopnorensis]|uniref:ABC transporter substrate-binding protein n=1 Tax=Allosalinactinospora lopnorensis TaxID=1352348 RepID=UPI000623F5FA|nr:ABC transporter substrate-binding protein [Allosalinactinospora lopnorensis]
MKQQLKLTSGAAALLLAAACTGGGGGDTGELDEVTLMLNWYPYGEHAPLYYGLEQGIFEEHGIDLSIEPGQGSQRTVQAAGAGQADFGWADTPALLASAGEGVPVRSLGVYLQTTPSAVQFFAEEEIEEPADLEGLTLASTAGDALTTTFPAFLAANDIDEDAVEIQNTDSAGKISAVASGQTDGLLGFAHDQAPKMAEETGREVDVLRYADWNLNYYGNGLLTSESAVESDEDLVQRMVTATQESWSAAQDNPEKAVAAMEGASEQLPSDQVLTEQLDATFELLHTDATEGEAPGVNAEEDWQQTIDILIETGFIEEAGTPDAYWTGEFAEAQ